MAALEAERNTGCGPVTSPPVKTLLRPIEEMDAKKFKALVGDKPWKYARRLSLFKVLQGYAYVSLFHREVHDSQRTKNGSFDSSKNTRDTVLGHDHH